MTLSLPQLPGHDLLTHSRLTCRKTCARKHYFRYVLGVRKRVSSAALRLGTGVHAGLDARNKGHDEQSAIAIACAPYADAITAAQTPEHAFDLAVESETVARLLAGYFWRWQVGEADPDIDSIVASEVAFDFPIRNPETNATTRTYRFAGKIDGIARLRDGRLAVVEHKTAKSPDENYWARLQIDQQISGYYIAAHELGHLVQTVLYDVIKKPGIRPKAVTKDLAKVWAQERTYFGEDFSDTEIVAGMTETPAMYGARLADEIHNDPDKYYVRREIPRLQADIDDFRAELWQMQQDMADAMKKGRHYRNTAACVGFGACEYLPICANGIDPDNPPDGFVRVDHLHTELQETEE